ncbi:MAG TPA: hypothetical protein ENN57_01495 [Chloroflexi bacterium]|nr:hypothetical protein [Chloroflexota bacterium]
MPALAQGSSTVTVTISMVGAHEISISLDKTEWPLGKVAPNTEYTTIPAIEWCTLTVTGNCDVNTFIVGEDAKWVDNPDAYKWTLSNDGTNGDHTYGLWFRVSGDTTRGYVPITKTESELWPYADGSSLAAGSTRKFGLKLLTPTYFIGDREMQTKITISAVAA